MAMKVAVAAGLSFLTIAYWQRERQAAKMWTLSGISVKVLPMLMRRSLLLQQEATEEEWKRDKQLCQLMNSASESELLEFQLACVCVDLLKVLSVAITDPLCIRKQLIRIQQNLSDGQKAREQLADALQQIKDLRKENEEKSETLANLHSQLREVLSVNSAHIEEQLVCIQNSLAEGNSAKEKLQGALVDIKNLREAKRVQIREYSAKQREYEQLLESFRECSQTLTVSKLRTADLQEQLHRLRTDHTSSESRFQSLSEKHLNLKSLKETQDKKLEEQRKALAKSQPITNENKALKQSLKESRKLNETLEQAQQFLEKEVDNSSDKVREIQEWKKDYC